MICTIYNLGEKVIYCSPVGGLCPLYSGEDAIGSLGWRDLVNGAEKGVIVQNVRTRAESLHEITKSSSVHT
jgi:hypothetical protein